MLFNSELIKCRFVWEFTIIIFLQFHTRVFQIDFSKEREKERGREMKGMKYLRCKAQHQGFNWEIEITQQIK
jgi:hypothetical protein